MKKIFILIIVFFISISTSFGFLDDNNFSWAKNAVNKWSLNGYILGYPDGTFRGNNNITRAEVVAIINKLNNSYVVANKRVGKDIEINNWFFGDMGKAVSAGLISVDTDGNLRPNEFATREDVMVILSKLLNVSYSGNLDNAKVKKFLDCNEISSNNYKRVAGIVEEGFVSGYADNTLKPKNNITRAEFICILDNAIQKIYTSGEYNNMILKGNIIINGKDVKIINSEIDGRVFILDGAKNGMPDFINTKVSGGINSRVGEILTKNFDDFQTTTEYNYNNPRNIHELVVAKLSYSETDWTNDDVTVKVSLDNKNYKPVDGNDKIIFRKNGEKEVEYEYEEDILKVRTEVKNIDKIVPKLTASVQNNETYAIITVEVNDDGLSPIKEITCNGVTNKKDEETGIIENIFTVTKDGNYKITAKDEAGNVGDTKVSVKITRTVTANVESKEGYSIITVDFSSDEINPVVEVTCNGVTNIRNEKTGNIENTFKVTNAGKYKITIKDRGGNIIETEVTIDEIKPTIV